MRKNWLLLVILLLVAIGLGSYFLAHNKTLPHLNQSLLPQTPLLEGTTQKLSTDLGLVIQTPYEKLNNIYPSVVYYTAGVYRQGMYTGYTRYAVIRDAVDPTGPATYIFASKDGKTYLLDKNSLPFYPNNSDGSNDPLYELNKNKVTQVVALPTDLPQIINLDDEFALNKNMVLIDSIPTGKKDTYGNPQYSPVLITQFSTYNRLTSPNPLIHFYSRSALVTGFADYSTPGNSPEGNIRNRYITGTTQLLVTDSTGFGYSYDLTTPQTASKYSDQEKNYVVQMNIYIKKQKEYQSQYNQLQKKGLTDAQIANQFPFPQYPTYPQRPNLRLKKTQITTTQQLYKTYDVAIPQSCATDVNTIVLKNIHPSDIQIIGTSYEGQMYVLKNKNHPLNKLAYQNKTNIPDADFVAVNGFAKPTFEQYVSKNPLLLLKDYWGRYVALGEYDIKLMGGCGKPVLYLYPQKPTDVSVHFTTPIDFELTIPSYINGWNVTAYPDGTLVDLQPELTFCEHIDVKKRGSEYAADACRSHTYPYLYWTGTSIQKSYPSISQGWIVQQQDLYSFMIQKLNEVGLSEKEKIDMLSYWMPEMLAKQAPYYKISFLQTREMNEIAPMSIDPAPVHTYRIFLDYTPLIEKPTQELVPQTLDHIVRQGFTAIEWGGLRK